MPTILVVDNHPENVELLRYLLESGGHKVVTALGGRAGLRRAQELHPELVVIDLNMPDVDGWELAQRIRRDDALADVRLLAVSVGPAAEGDAREAGFDGFFWMPFEPKDLIGTVDALLAAGDEG